MRNILFTTTLAAGLILSLSSNADDSALKACLDSNSDKPNKTTLCDMQQLQAAIDARNKDLDEKYKQAKSDLQKEQDELKKKQASTQQKPSEGSSSSTGSASNTSSSSPDNSGTTNNTKTEDSSSTSVSSSQSQPEKATQQPQSGYGKKPSPTIQWY
ncbi:MAG: hypothetical protein K2X50_03940 [Gammaproteobacteria bacterium]|nr:hypothetical protein [Gammaproteobacteria bacterium]